MNYWNARALSALFVSLLAAAPAGAAQNVGFSFSVGGEYTNGDYGTGQDTTIWYFPLTFRADIDEHSIALTLPFLIVDGPATVVPSPRGGGMPSGFAPRGSDTNAGIGDILLVGTLNLSREDQRGARMDLTGKIKFGTADRDDNLGTGEDDYAVQLDLERTFGANTLFGSFGYWFFGEPPGVNYSDSFYGSVGADHRFSDTTSAGLSFYLQEAAVSGTDDPVDLTLFLSSQADPRTKVTGYVLKGLSDGSPDWGAGLVVKFSQ
jgi:hypothetical protein